MSQYTPSQLVFSDESAYDRRTSARHYGWNFSGLRAQKHVFFVRGRRFTIEGALCINGLLAVLVLENASIHKSQYLQDLCEEKGVRLEFLPAYSLDYNP
ncbi:11418_t:CDS:2, partial [Dentiscutata heterogama]